MAQSQTSMANSWLAELGSETKSVFLKFCLENSFL